MTNKIRKITLFGLFFGAMSVTINAKPAQEGAKRFQGLRRQQRAGHHEFFVRQRPLVACHRATALHDFLL